MSLQSRQQQQQRYSQQDLLDLIYNHLGGSADKKGWRDVACPNCGKPVKKGQVHFHYNAGCFKCFVCGYSGSLYRLAQDLGLVGDHEKVILPRRNAPPVQAPPEAPPAWMAYGETIVEGHLMHPMRLDLWQRYKPLSEATIVNYDLGAGIVPGWERKGVCLTVPVRHKFGHLIGIRGRSLNNDGGPKWVNASGTGAYLYNMGALTGGERALWIVENMIDALFLMQEHPNFDAVAPTTGVATWRDGWTEEIAAARYELVIVAYDNDLPGQAAGTQRRALEDEWKLQHPEQKPPAANGPKVANALLRAGVNAVLFKWSENCPAKADIGWLLSEGLVAA